MESRSLKSRSTAHGAVRSTCSFAPHGSQPFRRELAITLCQLAIDATIVDPKFMPLLSAQRGVCVMSITPQSTIGLRSLKEAKDEFKGNHLRMRSMYFGWAGIAHSRVFRV